MPEDRRLAAIMFTDIVGYTALMGSDEDKAFDMLKRNHEIHENLIKQFNGTLIKEIGDGTLASFPLASNAVRCAIEIQKEAKDQVIPLRIGIHEGEMVMAGADVLGDGVNIASRLQELSAEGCITISGRVYSDVKNKAGIKTKFIGTKKLKNVTDTVKVYEVLSKEESTFSNKANRRTIKLPFYIIAGLMAIIVAILIIWKFIPFKEKVELEKSIAILPLDYLSEDQSKQYLADGVLNAITGHLSKIEGLIVRPRTTIEQYRGTNKAAGVIGKELNVSYLIEGSFLMVENQVRLTIQLINTKDEDHILFKEYDRDWKDIFNVQSEIAQAIAEEVETIVTPEVKQRIESIPTKNLVAYDYYLQGLKSYYTYLNRQEIFLLNSSISIFKKATVVDPNFAMAYAELANSMFDKYLSHYQGIEWADSALYFADYALSLDKNLDDPYRVRGRILQSKEDIEKAINLNPNSDKSYYTLGWYYLLRSDFALAMKNYINAANLNKTHPYYYCMIGRLYSTFLLMDEAEKYYNKALDLQPDFSRAYHLFMMDAIYLKQYQTVLKYAKIKYDLNPDRLWNKMHLAEAYSFVKNYSEAEKYFRIIEKIIRDTTHHEHPGSAPFRHRLGYVLWQLGENEEAIQLFNEQMERDKYMLEVNQYTRGEYYDLAIVNAFLGNKEEAFYWLDQLLETKPYDVFDYRFLLQEPMFESIREDKRFIAVINKMKDYMLKEKKKFEQSGVKGVL